MLSIEEGRPMRGKITLDEHYEAPDFPATGSHAFADQECFADVQPRLQDVDRRVDDMDRHGIGISVLSLIQPGIGRITDARDLMGQRDAHAPIQ
jgi:2,3-dihydroxybenzoate decarboxylase